MPDSVGYNNYTPGTKHYITVQSFKHFESKEFINLHHMPGSNGIHNRHVIVARMFSKINYSLSLPEFTNIVCVGVLCSPASSANLL